MKIRPTVTMLFLAALTFLVLGVVPSAGAKSDKQTVCHRTGSSKNPYVVISPSKIAGGHSKHPDKNGHNDKKVPSSPSTRSTISCAALLVKVIARTA